MAGYDTPYGSTATCIPVQGSPAIPSKPFLSCYTRGSARKNAQFQDHTWSSLRFTQFHFTASRIGLSQTAVNCYKPFVGKGKPTSSSKGWTVHDPQTRSEMKRRTCGTVIVTPGPLLLSFATEYPEVSLLNRCEGLCLSGGHRQPTNALLVLFVPKPSKGNDTNPKRSSFL